MPDEPDQPTPRIRAEITDRSAEEVEAERDSYVPLTDAVRRLMQAALRTQVDVATLDAAAAEIDAVAERLETEMNDGSLGLTVTRDGRAFAFGNAVAGARNPIALPLKIDVADGRVSSRFDLNPLFEGPPGMVHGGVIALVLDQVLGEAATAAGSPGMTGTLKVRYVRPTPLGACSATAWVDRTDGIKTIVRGELRNSDDKVSAEAEGIFILPRWARDAIARGGPKPAAFE